MVVGLRLFCFVYVRCFATQHISQPIDIFYSSLNPLTPPLTAPLTPPRSRFLSGLKPIHSSLLTSSGAFVSFLELHGQPIKDSSDSGDLPPPQDVSVINVVKEAAALAAKAIADARPPSPSTVVTPSVEASADPGAGAGDLGRGGGPDDDDELGSREKLYLSLSKIPQVTSISNASESTNMSIVLPRPLAGQDAFVQAVSALALSAATMAASATFGPSGVNTCLDSKKQEGQCAMLITVCNTKNQKLNCSITESRGHTRTANVDQFDTVNTCVYQATVELLKSMVESVALDLPDVSLPCNMLSKQLTVTSNCLLRVMVAFYFPSTGALRSMVPSFKAWVGDIQTSKWGTGEHTSAAQALRMAVANLSSKQSLEMCEAVFGPFSGSSVFPTDSDRQLAR